MKKSFSKLAVLFSVVTIVMGLVFSLPALAINDDSILSQHIQEADGTSGQDTNAGSGIKTGHIQDGAVISGKIATGAVTDTKITGPISPSKIATYQNELVVHKGSADNVHTFNTIGAALAGITDASASNRYLVTVKPGIYNESVTMKQYVDVVGSGQENTKITYTTSTSGTATVIGADDSSLENIWVDNPGATSGPTIAILNNNASMSIRKVNVTLNANCSNYCEAYGIFNTGTGSTATISDSIISVINNVGSGTDAIGIAAENGADIKIVNCTVTAEGKQWTPAIVSFSKVTVSYTHAKSIGGKWNLTLDLEGSVSEMVVNNSRAEAINGINENYALRSPGNTATVTNSELLGGGGTQNCAVQIDGYSEMTKIGSSLIKGGICPNVGTSKVVNCWDGDFNPIPNQ